MSRRPILAARELYKRDILGVLNLLKEWKIDNGI